MFGVVVVCPSMANEDGDVPIVHYVGYPSQPTQQDIDSLKDELRTDESFELSEIVDELEFYPASEELVEFYNNIIAEAGGFDDNKVIDFDINPN